MPSLGDVLRARAERPLADAALSSAKPRPLADATRSSRPLADALSASSSAARGGAIVLNLTVTTDWFKRPLLICAT